MSRRISVVFAALALAIVAMGMAGCSALQSATSSAAVNVLEEGFTPPSLTLDDVDMGCTYGTAVIPLVSAARHFNGDPSLLEAVLLELSSVCAEARSVEEELRYLRAAREQRSDEALDARIRQKQMLAIAGRREYLSFERMRSRLEAKYKFVYGRGCPAFTRDFDEMAYLLASIAGVQAVQSSLGAERAVVVPLDIAPAVESAMKCLDNEKWWGAPEALQAVIWTIIPGADRGSAIQARFEHSMGIGERRGVRIAHVMAALAAQSNDDASAIQAVVRRFANANGFKVDPEYRLIDAIAELHMTQQSDRLWTRNTGARTPINRLGKFWNDKNGDAVDADDFLR